MPTFDNDSCKRIVEATRWVEGQPRNAPVPSRGTRPAPYYKVGKLTSALTARSGSTPGSGTVQPYLLTPTSMTASGSTLTIYNWTGSSVASGKPVEYTVIDGYLFFNGNDCSGVALP